MAVVEMLLREKEELIKKGVRKGKTQGITEGKTQGEKEMQEKIIIEMLNLKMDDETIQKVTRISLEELNILKKRNECSKENTTFILYKHNFLMPNESLYLNQIHVA